MYFIYLSFKTFGFLKKLLSWGAFTKWQRVVKFKKHLQSGATLQFGANEDALPQVREYLC